MIISLVFSVLFIYVSVIFSVFFNLEVILYTAKITDWGPWPFAIFKVYRMERALSYQVLFMHHWILPSETYDILVETTCWRTTTRMRMASLIGRLWEATNDKQVFSQASKASRFLFQIVCFFIALSSLTLRLDLGKKMFNLISHYGLSFFCSSV